MINTPKNWRTTAAGIIGAAAVVILPGLQDGTINQEQIVTAVAIAVLSWFAKDAGVTGPEK